ncbi:arrestin domain-containing protein [Xylaria nigripes]|nr:arrestin domain-containing protein [Xylaria nigripes]
MPSLNPFAFVANRHCSLFEIRLDKEFVVFRGSGDEASGQLLKGVVVLCIKEPIKVEDVHLRFTGQSRLAWLDARYTPSNQRVDRSRSIVKSAWVLFSGDSNSHLAAGNYEWPFEITLPGNTPESVEGLYQTGITYLFKATVSRGKLAKNLHAFKRLRIIRTLDPAALEFNHAMTVDNTWPDKVDYSFATPQKAVVFGSTVPLELRFTPLLKGLEIGNIYVKLVEVHEWTVSGPGIPMRTHKYDREVWVWPIEVTREKHWQEIVEETGQEGWVVHQDLPLPKKLHRCVQDCDVEGIKIRHKFKMHISLNNPDGHVSELRASLPIVLFISPNMPLDEEGNIITQAPDAAAVTPDMNFNTAPPGYGQHVLDQLYEDVDVASGILTPGIHSGVNSPFYALSRAGSSENLALSPHSAAVPPAALSTRLLQTMSLGESLERGFHPPPHEPGLGTRTPRHPSDNEPTATDSSQPHSPELSRPASEEGNPGSSGYQARPEHQAPPPRADFPSVEQLSRVPSYGTATRSYVIRRSGLADTLELPDYTTATTAPSSPTQNINDPIAAHVEHAGLEGTESETGTGRSSNGTSTSRSHFPGFSFLSGHSSGDSQDSERGRKHYQQRRGGGS